MTGINPPRNQVICCMDPWLRDELKAGWSLRVVVREWYWS